MNTFTRLLSACVLVTMLMASCKKGDGPPATTPDQTVETKPPVLKAVTRNFGANSGGYYVGLPAMYNQTTKKYPLLIFIHGSGQYGDGVADLYKTLTAGPPQLLRDSAFPPDFLVNGQHFSFITLIPQFKGDPSPADVNAFVAGAMPGYRIDTTRIYISGLSQGARTTVEYAAYNAPKLAAIVPFAGAILYDLPQFGKFMADNKLAVWSFHNKADQVINVSESQNFIASINSFNPAIPARLTIFPTSDSYLQHDAWTIPMNPAYKEEGKNIYEWMLQYKK